MKTPVMGLMLGMLAVGGLMAVGALHNGQAYAQLDISPSNTAAAANSNNQPVTQTNAASISQYAKTKCKASVSDDDLAQVGDNVNTAANDCDTTQSAEVGQSNDNTQTTTQNALAIACQSLSLGLGSSACGNGAQNGGGDNGGEQLEVICHVPPGNPEQARTLVLPESAAEAHLEQHELDHTGPCTGSEGD